MSVIVQVTVVVPTAYVPLALAVPLKLFVMLRMPQLSLVPVGSGTFTTALHEPDSVLVTTLAGQVIVGDSVSCTVTVCVVVTLLPWISVIVQVTVVVPTAYV